MRASVKSLVAIGAATWLGGCAVGSFDLGRGTSTASAPPVPSAEPAAVPGSAGYPAPPEPGALPPEPLLSPAPPPQTTATAPLPPATYQPPAYQAPPTPRQYGPHSTPAGRAARAPDPPPAPQQAPDVLTLQEAREQCWMASENTRHARNLDQKVKFVEKCVEDKLRAAGH